MITININSTDVTSRVDFKSFRIRNKINNEVDECNFLIRKTTSNTYIPDLNDDIEILNDSNVLFGGVVVKIEEVSNAGNNIIYKIRAIDYSHLLKRQLVTERYSTTTVDAIIDDLVSSYTTDGFTTNNVIITRDVATISFNGLTVKDCLDKLAQSLNAYWYVDYEKDIHFFFKSEELTPFNLTDTSENYVYDSLIITEDITQLRNKVTVKGGTTQSTSDRVEVNIVQDADEGTYPLGNKFAVLPTVKIDSVAITVGTEYLDDEATVDCVWNFNEKYIRFTDGNLPTAGEKIEVSGKILIPVVVRIPDEESIAENGVFEYKIDDKTINSNDEAIERAITELNAYASEINEGSFLTFNDGLKAGQKLNINSVERGKNIDVIITEVKVKYLDPTGARIQYEVKFATVKTLGIIEFLQNSLLDEEVDIDAQETLLNFFQVSDDMALDFTEIITLTSLFAIQYNWGVDDDQMNWDFGVWGFRYRYGDSNATYDFAVWE